MFLASAWTPIMPIDEQELRAAEEMGNPVDEARELLVFSISWL